LPGGARYKIVTRVFNPGPSARSSLLNPVLNPNSTEAAFRRLLKPFLFRTVLLHLAHKGEGEVRRRCTIQIVTLTLPNDTGRVSLDLTVRNRHAAQATNAPAAAAALAAAAPQHRAPVVAHGTEASRGMALARHIGSRMTSQRQIFMSDNE